LKGGWGEPTEGNWNTIDSAFGIKGLTIEASLNFTGSDGRQLTAIFQKIPAAKSGSVS
jgi:hypothetical protein